MNKAGTTNSNATVPSNMPPTVPTPTERLPLAPTPVANINGNMPNTMVSDVISMGRNRALAADMAAAAIVMPSRRRDEAYSVSRMAVLANRPISIISPVCI